MEQPEKRKKAPQFILPQDADVVNVLGFTHGMETLLHLAFMSLPPDMPRELADIEHFAQVVAIHFAERHPYDANDLEAFKREYATGHKAGYLFALSASSAGLLDFYRPLSEEERFHTSFRFANEIYVSEPAPPCEQATVIRALDQVRELYKAYRASEWPSATDQ